MYPVSVPWLASFPIKRRRDPPGPGYLAQFFLDRRVVSFWSGLPTACLTLRRRRSHISLFLSSRRSAKPDLSLADWAYWTPQYLHAAVASPCHSFPNRPRPQHLLNLLMGLVSWRRDSFHANFRNPGVAFLRVFLSR